MKSHDGRDRLGRGLGALLGNYLEPAPSTRGSASDVSDWGVSDGEIDLRDYVDTIRRRWWIPALVALAAGATVYWQGLSEPATYTAEVLLQRQETGTSIGQIGLGLGTGVTLEDVSTQIEILRSRSVVAAVIDTLELALRTDPPHVPRSRVLAIVRVDPDAPSAEYELDATSERIVLVERETGAVVGEAATDGLLGGPGFVLMLTDAGQPLREAEVPLTFSVALRNDLIEDLAEALDIEHVRGTNLIRLAYSSPDRELAASVVNTLAESYEVYSGRRARGEARQRREFLASQLAQLADSMAVAQQELAEYQEQSQTLNPEIEGTTLSDALFQEEGELRRLRFEEAILAGVVRSLQSGDTTNQVYERMLTMGTDVVPVARDMYERLQELEG